MSLQQHQSFANTEQTLLLYVVQRVSESAEQLAINPQLQGSGLTHDPSLWGIDESCISLSRRNVLF